MLILQTRADFEQLYLLSFLESLLKLKLFSLIKSVFIPTILFNTLVPLHDDEINQPLQTYMLEVCILNRYMYTIQQSIRLPYFYSIIYCIKTGQLKRILFFILRKFLMIQIKIMLPIRHTLRAYSANVKNIRVMGSQAKS